MPGNLYFFNISSIICLSVHNGGSVIENLSAFTVIFAGVLLDIFGSIKNDLRL